MIRKKGLHINKIDWINMTPDELENFAIKIFTHYREIGFPYFQTDDATRQKDFENLMKHDFKRLFVGSIIKQSMHGLGLAWSYFPHSFNVRSNGKMTPYEAFMNDDIFMRVIRKRLQMGTYIADSGIRKMLKIYSGVQGVSNFRPTAAACIYDMYAKNGVVWDMSGGWGGRLLGAIAGGVKHYIATEPSKLSFQGLHNMAEDFAGNMDYEIFNAGSEDYQPEKGMLDLCFTSPPYFNLEKYSDEPSQSYIRFNTKQEWVDGYLRKTFENCYYGLKHGGYMLINIADVKGKHNINLEWETIITAERVGFKHETTYQLALSNVNLQDKKTQFNYEPIFVFVK
jgi:hypothetical protein